MQKPTYTKLAADGSDLPADSTEKHLAVRVEHPMLAKPIVISAYRVAERAKFSEVKDLCEKFDANGWTWRAPSVEELFFVADRTNVDEVLDPNFFPDAEGWESTWSGDVDAVSPADFAWVVNLGFGYAFRYGQGYRYLVRAVRSGQ